ncbi:unnamed protein product [Tilletia laevis]|uniref:Tyr recombinase domain-containing protein n=3 Tax=Tilletia TaxID=13289 RepID=A0ABN7J0T7_9BASI|nr:unnamed protein product [Tilletia caries]CAD6904382.1 unnamed protein product [Tilletia laevis]CAD6939599.1 unnamed protein product [Tilletia caries]CAD7060845.1 unnamed protein product [Tilletia caries]
MPDRFQQFRVNNTIHTRGTMKAQKLMWWNEMLISGVMMELGTVERVGEILRGRMAPRQDGLYFKLRMFCSTLITSLKLDRHKQKGKLYGRPELTILLLVNEERMNRSAYAVQSGLQLQALLLISFYTGLRPSSLVQYERDSAYAKDQDITIVKRGQFAFTIELEINSLKGWNQVPKEARQQRWIIHSATKSHNAPFDLNACLIPLLAFRGGIVEAETGRSIRTIDDFLNSRASDFRVLGDGPLFLSAGQGLSGLLPNKPLQGSNMASVIGSLCEEAGLPGSGSYAFRHEAGNRMALTQGAEAAKQLLGQDLHRDLVRKHYSHDTANVNVTALALEEDIGPEARAIIDRSNSFYLQWSGYDVRAMEVLRREQRTASPLVQSQGQTFRIGRGHSPPMSGRKLSSKTIKDQPHRGDTPHRAHHYRPSA